MKIWFESKIDKFWSYRSAVMSYKNIRIEFEVDNDLHTAIERFLNENGYKIDNHICWKSGDLYCCYSDGRLRIGDGVTEGNY